MKKKKKKAREEEEVAGGKIKNQDCLSVLSVNTGNLNYSHKAE